MLLAVATLAAIAFAAPSAPAQSLEFSGEWDGTHCPAVHKTVTDVNGGCLFHAFPDHTTIFRKHVFGIESTITYCHLELHGRIDENGSGYALEQNLSGCSRQACATNGEGDPWPFTSSELGGNTKAMTLTLCIEPTGGGTDETCEIDLPFRDIAGHGYELGNGSELASHGTSGFRCELEGHWVMESGSTHDGQAEIPFEVTHLN
jgi:hypothetical protein